jgi:nucleotide-binding universal stress UspA family protein
MNAPKRILVPLAFSEQSAHALEYAKMPGKALDASLDLLHVVPNPYIADPSGLSLALRSRCWTSSIGRPERVWRRS